MRLPEEWVRMCEDFLMRPASLTPLMPTVPLPNRCWPLFLPLSLIFVKWLLHDSVLYPPMSTDALLQVAERWKPSSSPLWKSREHQMWLASDSGGLGSYCLVGVEFQFCKMKRIMKMGNEDSCTTVWVGLTLPKDDRDVLHAVSSRNVQELAMIRTCYFQ